MVPPEVGPLNEEAVGNGMNQPAGERGPLDPREALDVDDAGPEQTTDVAERDGHSGTGSEDHAGAEAGYDPERKNQVPQQIRDIAVRRVVGIDHLFAIEQRPRIRLVECRPAALESRPKVRELDQLKEVPAVRRDEHALLAR